MTEIQWLVDIMLHHKLPEAVKEKFISRIGEVEANYSKPVVRPIPPPMHAQTPSTQKILDEMAQDTIQVAQTPAVAAALQSRQEAIKQAASGKPEPGRTSPRKF